MELMTDKSYSGKNRLLKFKYPQMITLKQEQSLKNHPCKSRYLIIDKTKMRNLLKVTRYERVHNRCNYTLHLGFE